jgi:hypothetical protein
VAVSSAAGSAKVAAGGAVERVVGRVQDLLPRRKPAYRRVTPLASRRETQRRAALAILALVLVVGGLGLAVYVFGGQGKQVAISSVNAGQNALDTAKANLAAVKAPGVDLVVDDPKQAKELLTEAYQELQAARKANVSPSVVGPLEKQAKAGLDRLYGVVPVATTTLFTFKPAEGGDPINLTGMVKGPDGAPYVIDASTKTVYRVDLKSKKATVVARSGQKAGGTTVATPRLLAVGGPDLLILDSKNVLWRWRPSNSSGKGTLTKIKVNGSASWGDDVSGIGTYLKDENRGLYNLYVIDPSEQQIRAYSPAFDGSGFPAASSGWLATARSVDGMSSLYIDGDLFVTEDGTLERFASGKNDGWKPDAPDDTLLRPDPEFSIVAGGTDRRTGVVYVYDKANERVIAIDKANGDYKGQFRLAGSQPGWDDLRAMAVTAGIDDAPDTLTWLSKDGVQQAALEAVPDVVPVATPIPSPSAAPAKTPKPTKKP